MTCAFRHVHWATGAEPFHMGIQTSYGPIRQSAASGPTPSVGAQTRQRDSPAAMTGILCET